MLAQTGRIVLCLLAVASSVHAQQSSTRRVFKIGGDALKQSAERLSSPYSGAGQVHAISDTSQAVATVGTAGTRETLDATRRADAAAAERAFAARQRDDAIKVAEMRVEFARQQVADLERYNQWVPPQDQLPMAVRMLPHSLSYAPVSMEDPVQSFVPRSTFAHVLMASDRELTDAESQLATLVAEREAFAATNDSPANNVGTSAADASSDDTGRLAYVEATLQRERFLAESAELRLTQLANMSELTYSGLYPSLYRKLELERLRHELAAQALEHERDTLNGDAVSP